MNLIRNHRLAAITCGLILGTGLAWIALQAAPAPASKPTPTTGSNTNGMMLVCDDGMVYSNKLPLLVFNKNVRVLDRDSDTYLECDRLTLTFQTNVTKQASTNKNAMLNAGGIASLGGHTNADVRVDIIYADGRVMIVTKDQQVLGEHAVYYATNDTMVVTGEHVILGSAEGITLCTKAVFDRANEVFRVVGQFATDLFAQPGTNKGGLLPSMKKPPKNTIAPAAAPAKK